MTAVATWVGVVGGLFSILFGLIQYQRGQTWKRLEFVIAEMRRFGEDPAIRRALLMLDWNARDYTVDVDGTGEPESFSIDDEDMIRALRHHTQRGPFTAKEDVIRGSFDALFDRLAQFELYFQFGVVNPTHFNQLPYYANILFRPEDGRKPKDFYMSVREYLEGYEFANTIRLAERYGHRVADLPKHATE